MTLGTRNSDTKQGRGSVKAGIPAGGEMHEDRRSQGAPQACLMVVYGTDLGARVEVSRGGVRIGRGPRNDLVLRLDAVSRNHARISQDEGKGFVITDEGSTNGTFVNDVRVNEAVLQDGDLIKVGRARLKFMMGSNIEADYHREVFRIMTLDGLTNVYNKAYFMEVLERECNRAKRYTRDLALIRMSLSNPGRELVGRDPSAGDDIFRNIVAKVRERLRREDIVGRVRRDDLAILLPEIGLSGARVAAEKIRQIVLSEHPMVDGNPVKIGVSMGIACEVPQVVVASNLYKSALQALNRAKQAGANVIST